MATPFDYIESRDDADELIQDFGQAVAVRRTTNSGTQWAPTQATADHSTYAARVEFTFRQLQGGNVQASDQRWLVAAGPLGSVVPSPTDKLVVNSVPVEIIRADAISPAGVAVMYDCQVRF